MNPNARKLIKLRIHQRCVHQGGCYGWQQPQDKFHKPSCDKPQYTHIKGQSMTKSCVYCVGVAAHAHTLVNNVAEVRRSRREREPKIITHTLSCGIFPLLR